MERDCAELIALQTGGRRPPLFCFPSRSAEVFTFSDMAAVMGKHRSIYAINMLSRYGSRSEIDIRELATFYLGVIRRNQDRGPYYLCGYSFGGLVAYEIAAILASAGEDIGLLALIDTPNPAFQAGISVGKAVQFQSVYVADRIRKYALNLLRGRIDVCFMDALAFASPRLRRVSWALIRSAFRTLNRPVPRSLIDSELVVVAAYRHYRPAPYAQRLVLIRSAERGPEYDRDLGWGQCVAGCIDVYAVPGNHWSIMTQPQVVHMVHQLKKYLDNDRAPEI